eukprot:TRINITY_DN68587_c0_g1_i1.p1 TRINITY_DN68587_c0_g1~~TRINITY_DN68587_c0_g1_i1.p1  ORF type:complete len:668 (-),score=134.10 TRINITY_DN68587_c0_g1_i1:21-2024(-)
MPPKRGSIRFEDLGPEMQSLIMELHSVDVDTDLFNFVSVRDIATVTDKRAQGLNAQEIWKALEGGLRARKRQAEQAAEDVQQSQRQAEEEAQKLREEEAARQREAEAEAQRQREEQARQAQLRQAEEARRRQEAEAQEEQRRRQVLAEEERRKQAQEEEQRRQVELERQQEEARKAREDAERKRREQEELEETLRRRKQEEADSLENMLRTEERRRAAEQQRLAEIEAENIRKAQFLLQASNPPPPPPSAPVAVPSPAPAPRPQLQAKVAQKQRAFLEEEQQRRRQPNITVDNYHAEWQYFAMGDWHTFPPNVADILEHAHAAGAEQCDIPFSGALFTAFLLKMYARDTQGRILPMLRRCSDDPRSDTLWTAAPSGQFVVWSSLNPLSTKLERFPHSASLALESRFQAGEASVEVLIMGQLKFAVIFKEMKQINEWQQFRRVERTPLKPQWETFNPALPGWEPVAPTVNSQIEECFAAGEQEAEVLAKEGLNLKFNLHRMQHQGPTGPQPLRRAPVPVTGAQNQDGQPEAGSPRALARAYSGTGLATVLEVYGTPEDVPKILRNEIQPSERIVLPAGRFFVGRVPDKQPAVVISRQDISRVHCSFEQASGGYQVIVEDLGSSGGTLLFSPSTGKYLQLAPNKSVPVPIGSILVLGNTAVRLTSRKRP